MLKNRTITSALPIFLGAGIVLLGCLLIGGTLFLAFAVPREGYSDTTPIAAASSTRVLSFPTATAPPSATPTPTHTLTPMPTETPSPTDTPVPPTRRPSTRIPSTPVPTNTVVLPTAAPPGAQHGITVYYFQPLYTSFARNSEIGFKFKIKNTSTSQVGFGFLGANCVDMAGEYVFFQASWQGPGHDAKYWLNPGDEIEWTDFRGNGIANPGVYKIQLAICYSTPGACNTSGAGDWEALSPFTEITIN